MNQNNPFNNLSSHNEDQVFTNPPSKIGLNVQASPFMLKNPSPFSSPPVSQVQASPFSDPSLTLNGRPNTFSSYQTPSSFYQPFENEFQPFHPESSDSHINFKPSFSPEPEPEMEFEEAPPILREICAFALKGNCRYGEYCRYAHGTLCSQCEKYVFHPDQTSEEHQFHINTCRIERVIDPDEDIECCICMEKVKSTKCKKFGLLSCEHPFCLTCIRHWRSNSEFDNTLIRSCPICRSTSYFITPSHSWITDSEDKDRLIEAYKIKLKQIPCKHFDQGQGQCPFGTSCFYDHVYPDGTREEVELRKIKNANEETQILNNVKLSDFFDRMEARQ